MAQYQAESAQKLPAKESNENLLNAAGIKQVPLKLLLLTQDNTGRTIDERFINIDRSFLQEIAGDLSGQKQLWYNDPKMGRYLIDNTEDMQATLQLGLGLGIRTSE